MASCDVFLNFRGQDTRKSFTDNTSYGDKKQSVSVIVEDFVSSIQEVLHHRAIRESLDVAIIESLDCSIGMLSYDLSTLCLDEHVNIINHIREKEWSNTSAFSKECILPSSKRGFGCDEINGTEKARSWRKTPAKAIEMVVVTYLMAQKEVVPHSAFCNYSDLFSNLQKLLGISWKAATAAAAARTTVKISVLYEFPSSILYACCKYRDLFPNLQKLKGISWKAATAAAAARTVKISVLSEFPSSISAGDHYEDVDLHLAFSTRQLQPCTKMSSSASKLSFISNPRACESDDVRYLNSGCIEGLHPTHIPCYSFIGVGGIGKTSLQNMIKTIHQAPSAPLFPTSESALANHYTARKTSITALLVTICVVSTFVAALGFSSLSFKEAHLTGKDATASRSIIAMNSLVFIVSLVTDMFLLNEFTYKWELQIALFALFGAYICLMKVMIPQAALPMFLLSVPFLLFAAAEDVDVVQ